MLSNSRALHARAATMSIRVAHIGVKTSCDPRDAFVSGDDDLTYWRERLESPCFVYVIESGPDRAIKIGIAKNVKRRIGTLQVGNPRELKLLHVLPANSAANALSIEKELHRRARASAVRGEWFMGADANLVLTIVEGMALKMRDVHDGSGTAPHFWALFPEPPASQIDDWSYQEAETPERLADCEAGIAPLPEEYWPRISNMFMDHWTMEEMAVELDITIGRLERTMTRMRFFGGYELDPRARRVRDWGVGDVPQVGGHRSGFRW